MWKLLHGEIKRGKLKEILGIIVCLKFWKVQLLYMFLLCFVQLLYDLCLCWLLGSRSSTALCFEGSFTDSTSWENETSIILSLFPSLSDSLASPKSTHGVIDILVVWSMCFSGSYIIVICISSERQRESFSFIYRSFKWCSSLHWCCCSWIGYTWGWLHFAGKSENKYRRITWNLIIALDFAVYCMVMNLFITSIEANSFFVVRIRLGVKWLYFVLFSPHWHYDHMLESFHLNEILMFCA